MRRKETKMTLKFGIWGYGQHARKNFVPAIAAHSRFELAAVQTSQPASSVPEGVIHYSQSSEFLGSDIEIVYIGSPNGLHFEQAKQCLEAGKHVVIEKPAVISLAQAEELLAVASKSNLLVFEGFMYRYHPQFQKLLELAKVLGPVKKVQAQFAFPHLPKENIRYSAELKGGALADVGCYTLNLALEIFGEKPEKIQIHKSAEAGLEVDTAGDTLLIFSGDRTACLTWGFGYSFSSKAAVWTHSHYIEAERIFSKPKDFATTIEVRENKKDPTVYTTGASDNFDCMLSAVADAIDNDAVKEEAHEKLRMQAEVFADLYDAATSFSK